MYMWSAPTGWLAFKAMTFAAVSGDKGTCYDGVRLNLSALVDFLSFSL